VPRGRGRLRSLAAAALLAAGAAAGCELQRDPEEVAAPPVSLGAVYNLSGPQAALDGPAARGAQLAVAQANAAGGVLGRTVELALEDGRSTRHGVAEAARRLLERHSDVAALLGLSDTDMVLAAAPVAARAGRLFLTSGATSPRLPSQAAGDVFLACFGDNVQAAAAAEWAHGEREARTAAILYDSTSSYTALLQGYFATRFEQLGGRVVAVRGFAPDDLDPAIDSVPMADVVFLAAMPEQVGRGAARLRDRGFAGPILGGDSYDADAVWEEHPELSGVFFTTHGYLGADNPNPRVAAFRAAYAAAYDGAEPDAFAALGHDAVRLLLAALTGAGSDDPQAVTRALAGIERFEGLTGTLAYAEGSRVPAKSVFVLEGGGGRRRLVTEVTPRQVPAP
jgi:branched-chain amino acid transport system substrate-binding protein